MTSGRLVDTHASVHLPPAPRSHAAWWLCCLFLIALLALPLCIVDVPPIADYPNHFARDYVLAFSGQHEALSRMYQPNWGIIPNLASDLLLPPLMKIMSPFLAGKLVVSLAVLLPTTGAIAIHAAYFKTRSYWPLITGLFAYNGLFLLGFINFHIAVGLAFWSGAGWMWLSTKQPMLRIGFGIIASLACFICHLFGLITLMIIVFAWETTEISRRDQWGKGVKHVCMQFAVPVLAFLPVMLIYLSSQFSSTHGTSFKLSLFWYVHLLLPVFGYWDLLSTVLMLAILAISLLMLATKRLRVGRAGIVACLILGVLYVMLPFGAKQGLYINSRCIVVLAFLAFAFSLPIALGRRWGAVTFLVFGLCICARLGIVTKDWILSRQDVQAARDVLAPVPSGARVLVAKFDPSQPRSHGMASWPIGRNVPEFWTNFGAFAVIDRDAYWPGMFAYPGQQPLVNRPPFDELADVPGLQALEPRFLAKDYSGATPRGYGPLMKSWRDNFDYLLVMNSDKDTDLPESLRSELIPEKREGGFSLFKIPRPDALGRS